MITDTQIRKAIKETETETTLNAGGDGRGRGSLKLHIRRGTKGATAAWVAMWKSGGQRFKKTLGRYPELSLAEAREAYAKEISPVLRQGRDPRVTVVMNGQPTMERMLTAYIESLKARGVVSAVEVERVLLKCKGCAADTIGRHRLAGTVEPADVAHYLTGYFKAGARGAADKARAYLSSAFSWAMKSTFDYTAKARQDWGVKSNPAQAVPRDLGARKQRDRNLSAEELRALWWAADGDKPNWTDETAGCVRLLIVCGQRVMETLRIEGRDVDLDAGLWTMPAEKTKGRKRSHTIPLPQLAIDVLRPLKADHGDGQLFPTNGGENLPHIEHQSIKTAIDRWLATKPEGVAHFQTRDLRRTWKSRTGEIGISKDMRDRIQQHLQHDTGTLHYDRGDYLPQMREAMDKWQAWLIENVTGDSEKSSQAVAA